MNMLLSLSCSCSCSYAIRTSRPRRPLPFRPVRGRRQQCSPLRASAEPPPEGGSTNKRPEGQPSTSNPETVATADKLAGADKENLQIPKEVIERLRYTVFGIDTLWVTEVDNYDRDGVIFKGNLRGKDPASTYKKMRDRLKDVLGDSYLLYLLRDMDDKPTAVVLPASSLEPSSENVQGIRRIGEVWLSLVFALTTVLTLCMAAPGFKVWLSVVFALTTVLTSLQSNGAPIIDFVLDPSKSPATLEEMQGAVPGALLFWAILGAHELGHLVVARGAGVKETWPFIIPGGFGLLGSFGVISRFKSVVPDRPTLLNIAAAGPAAGASLSLAMLLAGFALTASGQGDTSIDTIGFANSTLVALLAQLFLPDQLAKPEVLVHPALLAGWAGLFVNALHCMPIGDLDGGRIAHAIFGRRIGSTTSALALLTLGVSAVFNTLAFYWVLLVLALARGPLLPQAEEFTEPSDVRVKAGGLALLALPLLVLPPFPVELAVALSQLQNPAPLL